MQGETIALLSRFDSVSGYNSTFFLSLPCILERAKRDPDTRWSRATLTFQNIREGPSVIRQLVALGFIEFKASRCAARVCCDRLFYPRWLIILSLQTAISNSIYSKLSKCVARQFTVIVWCCCRLTRCIYGKPVILQLWTSSSVISSRTNCCFAFECARPILAHFRQNRHNCQIHQHFRSLVAGLIYSLLSFRQQS